MPTWKRNFILVWMNNFITSLGMMAFIPLFPLFLQRELGVEDPASVRIWSGVIAAGAPFTAAFMGPFWGALSDRVGRKVMLLRANVAITVFVGLMTLVTTPLQLLLLRVCQGVFSGFMAPSLTLVSVAAPADRQGVVTGWLHTAILAGGVVGGLLGGFLADAVGLRWVFLLPAGLSLAAAVMTAVWVREIDHPRDRSHDQEKVAVVSLLRAAARDVVAFVSSPGFRSILLVVFVVRLGGRLVDPIIGLYVEEMQGVDAETLGRASGLIYSMPMVATLLMTPWWGRVGDRTSHDRMLAVCALGAALTYLPQAFVQHVIPLGLLRLASGVFIAGLFPAAYAMTARHSSLERRGSGFGLTFSSLILANALGPAMGGVLAAVLGLRTLFVVASMLMLGAGVWALAMALRRPGPGAASGAASGSLPDTGGAAVSGTP